MKAKHQSDTRQAILDRLRTRLVDKVALPKLEGEGSIGSEAITFADPVDQFVASVEGVGGACERVDNLDAARERLTSDSAFQSAQRICAITEGTVPGNVDLNSIADPHELADVDFAVAMAEFGVAENGALWLTDAKIKHRTILFITQRLALLVSADAIINNMHEAYARIGSLESSFGVFISGPSKTADIEQSLVLGAHGCRSLTVLIVD